MYNPREGDANSFATRAHCIMYTCMCKNPMNLLDMRNLYAQCTMQLPKQSQVPQTGLAGVASSLLPKRRAGLRPPACRLRAVAAAAAAVAASLRATASPPGTGSSASSSSTQPTSANRNSLKDTMPAQRAHHLDLRIDPMGSTIHASDFASLCILPEYTNSSWHALCLASRQRSYIKLSGASSLAMTVEQRSGSGPHA